MKTNPFQAAEFLASFKVGRVTPCAPQPNNAETARSGLTRPTAPRSSFALLFAVATSATICLFLLHPTSAHAQGGVPLWTNRYTGGSARALAVDSSGNVFVTGSSTIKYSNAGVLLWTNAGASAVAVDTNGNVFVTGSSQDIGSGADYATIAYSNSGAPLWTNWYDGGFDDSAKAIALDSSGNVFVTGSSRSSGDSTSSDYATVAYSNAGVPLWTNRYDGPANGPDFANAIAVDSSGNVFVTGESHNGDLSAPLDYATVAYSNSGVPLWTNRYSGPANNSAWPRAIAVDSSGNVFVTGISVGIGTSHDYATIKYSNTGVPLWTNRYNGPANGLDEPAAIAVDSSGNVFVTGFSSGAGTCNDYATIKYSNAGVPLWTKRYNGPGNYCDVANAIGIDRSDNVFVTGVSSSPDGLSWYAETIAYSNAGVMLWTSRYPAGVANAIAADRNGNVFVTGYSWNGTDDDYVTIKYSSSVPPPRLDFQKLNNELVLSWTNAGFHLQTAPAVTGPFTNLAGATSPYTNPLTAPQQFFRLASP